LAVLVDNAPEIIEIAGRLDPTAAGRPLDDRAIWQPTVKAADRAFAVEQPEPVIDYGLGIEL